MSAELLAERLANNNNNGNSAPEVWLYFKTPLSLNVTAVYKGKKMINKMWKMQQTTYHAEMNESSGAEYFVFLNGSLSSTSGTGFS